MSPWWWRSATIASDQVVTTAGAPEVFTTTGYEWCEVCARNVYADNTHELRHLVEAAEAAKNGAYSERNKTVVALAHMARLAGCRVGIREHNPADEGWDDDWRAILMIDLPTGQASWHFHDSERPMLAEFGPYPDEWDGHTTDEKYDRLAALRGLPGNHSDTEAEGRLAKAREALEGAFAGGLSNPNIVDRVLAEARREYIAPFEEAVRAQERGALRGAVSVMRMWMTHREGCTEVTPTACRCGLVQVLRNYDEIANPPQPVPDGEEA